MTTNKQATNRTFTGDMTEDLLPSLQQLFIEVRQQTENICNKLEIEDQAVQPAPFVSPPKWHLAHTSWFFDCFILEPLGLAQTAESAKYHYLFNSYYKSQGAHWLQAERGHLSRPTVNEVLQYRQRITEAIVSLFASNALSKEQLAIIATGIQHEQQHQELLFMDIKFILGQHPYPVAYHPIEEADKPLLLPARALAWLEWTENISLFGARIDEFSYDNERPRHRRWISGFQMADRLINNGEYLEFMTDGGYRRPELWLSDGWDWVQQNQINHPLYWRKANHQWDEYHLSGLEPLNPNLPVSHISLYEADAFARWSGARLPTEFELEAYTSRDKQLFDAKRAFWEPGELVYPAPERACDEFDNGLLWQWTSSAYSPYPGFKTTNTALGEYNGKFMANQYVLKGGCVATPKHHMRASYRNFYRPDDRWAFTGIRLARDL